MTTTRRRPGSAADFLTCRTLGHAWDPIPADGPARGGGDPWWLRCVRCATERHDDLNWMTGELVARRYVYPDGYAVDRDDWDVAPTRQDFRRMLLTEHLHAVRHLRALRAVS